MLTVVPAQDDLSMRGFVALLAVTVTFAVASL
jgi:hypothetical protein